MECSHEQHDECNLEVSGDSEEVSGVVPRPMAAEEEEEGDDAESCVEGDDDNRIDVIREETRWSSWRVWCEESATEYETIDKGNGCDASREKSTVEMEENRLFWEACLANDYSGQT